MSDRGSISLIAVTGTFILLIGALSVVDAGSFLYARARAQTAADAAALAAVVQQIPVLASSQAPVDAARAEAEANGVRLLGCECDRGARFASVTVEVDPPLLMLGAWQDRRVRARGVAEVDPALLSYRTNDKG
ncbi:MAG: hypothetical protein NVSMB57_07610 [Actinomycetota bacterium]